VVQILRLADRAVSPFSAIMPYSDYKKQRIVHWYAKGFKAPTIRHRLADEGLSATRQGIHMFLGKLQKTGTIARQPGSGRPSKVAGQVEQLIEAEMNENDETTVEELQKMLRNKGHPLSRSAILRCRKSLGWTTRGAAYCQMIREPNKVKRLEWARENINGNFDNVIWTDETSVQMESHRRFCCRKKSQKPRYKPRYASPYTVPCIVYLVLINLNNQ
jgi:transposase